ncbi:MAG: hypothetical protein ACLGIN_11370 [Candidatus Sericytochromatia bacterium]
MRTLLIVDDEAEILMLARMALKRQYHVLTAATGEAPWPSSPRRRSTP